MANYITIWNFNGNANDNFGNPSTTSNISFVNNTVVLNSQSLISVTNKSTYTFNNGITLAGRINQTTATQGYIISKADCFLLQIYNNKFQAGIYEVINGILTWTPLVSSTSNIVLNTWYDVTFTYNNYIAKLYVNNKLENITVYEGSIIQNTNEITIGNNASIIRGFIGSFDNVEMITNALTDEEVAKRYVLKSSEVYGDGICNGGENKDNCPVDCGIRITSRNLGDLYHTKDDSIILWKELVTNHPLFASYEVIGKSYEGRDILLFKFGNPNGGKFMFDGQIHGIEDSGTETGYVFVKWVLESTDTEAVRIKNNNYLLAIPIIDMDTIRRQNARRVNPDGTLVPYGVDLNRNFPTGWELATGSNPNDNLQYRGYAAGSEPETQAIIYAMDKYKPQIYLNVHNGGLARLKYYSTNSLTSKIISRISEISVQNGSSTMSIYNPSIAGGNGLLFSEAATRGANSWLTEICSWDELPKTLVEYNNIWYKQAFPIYAAMSNAIEIVPICPQPQCDFTIIES